MTERETLIEVDGVSRTFGTAPSRMRPNARQVHALKDVNLEIKRGERFGIVGESGSGKSTLIKLIAGLDDPTEGVVRFEGKQVSGTPERRLGFLREKLQFVFQDPMASLDPRMRVREIIAEPLIATKHPDPSARVLELLDAVGMPPETADRFPHQFSGGQRQRISIARALAPEPTVLIADEPVSALDVSVRAQILNLLHELVERFDLTLVFVSHDLSVVRYLCDRVSVLYHGDLVEVGDTEEIYASTAEPYTRSLIAAVPTLTDALAGVDAAQLATRMDAPSA
ncbi:ATP-binding cassette domain-containing protein [Demequina sp. NBRC 110054]|uniref:ATP-binding cassette domain-containing protein n=1 Tax=Demequina sp. NBRC 110054 TaxID=1570343 RepID=UPI0009FFFF43|nr:ATP-binding cassette domain-containing protein [Demequina sp. NBRC 110054]